MTTPQQHQPEQHARGPGISPGLPTGRVLVGDALKRLRRLPDQSVDTIVTSPPYYLLRDYGLPEQLGLEDSVHAWVTQLGRVMAEVGRVLKPGGSVWLNLGDTYARQPRHGAEPKSLLLGPERLVIALLKNGWRLRNRVVWAKPNPMPTSVKDRLATTWEPVYLLVRDRHYYFDLDAIRVPAPQSMPPSRPSGEGKYSAIGKPRPAWAGPVAGNNAGLERMKARGENSHPLGKNPGDVWTIPTGSYRGAHFATFPEALVHRPLLATCPERTCRGCGAPWRRSEAAKAIGELVLKGELRKSCPCPERLWQPGVVLDPFMGAGTVGVVAERLHRRWIGIEVNPTYAAQATARIDAARAATAA